jgi:bla regulator protein blaR1
VGAPDPKAAVRAAQAAAVDPDVPRFEVASVKPNLTTGPRLVAISNWRPGGFDATLMWLRSLIQLAYSVKGDRIIGGPSWIATDRFDITANAEGNPSIAERQLMLRTLLADRFKLVVHNETRDLPAFALVLTRKDGKLGSQLRAVTSGCERGVGLRNVGPSEKPPPCGIRRGLTRIEAWGFTMLQLADLLSPIAQRPVVDQTGLTGFFDVDLEWDPNANALRVDAIPGASAGADGTGATIFAAVRDQLGLKLDSQRAPTDVLVIDSVEKPTED